MDPYLENWLKAVIVSGYSTRAELLESLTEEADSPQEALAVLNKYWYRWEEELLKREGIEDDHGRLLRAYAELEAKGIVCEENFTCCQSCGHYEIKKRRPEDWGYLFFHEQIGGGDLYLAHGLFDFEGLPEKEADLRDELLAATAVEAFRSAGLTVDWDGSSGQRIHLHITDWRKPLPTGGGS